MENSVQVSARTVEEALDLAASRLGVVDEVLEYEIIAEPRRLLGVLGSGHYTIRAWVKADTAVSETPVPQEVASVAETPVAASPPTPAEPRGAKRTPEQVAERAREIAARIFELMNLPATVSVARADPEEIRLHIHSPQSQGLIIGRHGDTLDALQFLVAIAANRGEGGGYRIVLDVGGYRKRQAAKLVKLAHETADQAVATGQEAVLPGLKPYERRLVHLALAEREDVETYSEGEGEQRRLVISPKGGGEEAKDA